MLKHPLLSCLLCALFAPSFAQQPLTVYAEAGVGPRYRDVPYSVRAGLASGRHDFALEFGVGTEERAGYRYGMRYRLVMPASAAGERVLPFLQGGLSLGQRDYSEFGPGVYNRAVNVDVSTGLQVAVWKGLRLSANVGLRYSYAFAGPNRTFVYDFGPRIYTFGGVGLAYALPMRPAAAIDAEDAEPKPLKSRPHRHEVGLAMVSGNVAHYFPYADMRLHYAYRVHRHWDLRAAVDLPIWPLNNEYRDRFSNFWLPSAYAGGRFWATPTARFAVFGEGGLSYAHRYLPWFSDFLQRGAVLEPSLGAGVRANFSPALSLELSSQLRVMPYPGFPRGIADNAVHLGLNYRFGAPKASPLESF